MFDFDAGKLLIIGVVALIVIGPKDLPRVLRQIGQAVAKLRRMATEFQGQFMDAMKEADLQDIRTEVSKLKSSTDLSTHFDPARDIQRELTQAVSDPADAAVAKPKGKSFALPAPPPPPIIPETAGYAPAAVDAPSSSAAGLEAQKRKVVVRKRKPQPAAPVASRYRNVRPRREEADR